MVGKAPTSSQVSSPVESRLCWLGGPVTILELIPNVTSYQIGIIVSIILVLVKA